MIDNQVVNGKIQTLIDSLLPNGAGTMTEIRLKTALEQVAQVAFSEGKNYGLSGLLSAEEVAERLGVNRRRALFLIKERHERFGVGRMIGSATWTVHVDELPMLQPGPVGWKKGRPRGKRSSNENAL